MAPASACNTFAIAYLKRDSDTHKAGTLITRDGKPVIWLMPSEVHENDPFTYQEVTYYHHRFELLSKKRTKEDEHDPNG